MAKKWRAPGLIVSLSVLFSGVSLWATTQNASVTGLVYDQAGNPVSGAVVILFSENSGFKQQNTSDSDGSFTFNNVPPSDDYVLQVAKTGFETYVRPTLLEVSVAETKMVLPPITLAPVAQPDPAGSAAPHSPAILPAAGQPAPLLPEPPQAPVLTPPTAHPGLTQPLVSKGATIFRRSESVSAELISNTLGGVIDSQTARALPLAGRDFLDLALLAPGTYPVEQGSVLEGASLVVNGTRANMNTFLLDGADDNDYTLNQSLPFQIVEAMQEFRVQASTSSAEFGRSAGAQINTISRRGLNTVHGTLFEFHRNSAFSPNNFFSVYNGGTFDRYRREIKLFGIADISNDPTLVNLYNRSMSRLVQNQFGANIGGALKKDKLFGFVNWESFRASNPRPVFDRVPGMVLRSASACAAASSTGICDPVVQALYNLYPTPNVPTSSVIISGLNVPVSDQDVHAFFVGESANSTATDNYLGRIDWRKSDRSSSSFRHNLQQIVQVQGGAIPRTQNYPGSGTEVDGLNQNFSYNYVYQWTPHTGNELRLGWNRFRLDALALDRTVDPASLGLRNLNFHDRGLPTLSVGGSVSALSLTAFGMLGADLSVPSNRADNVWSLADNVISTRGKHNWKLGGELGYVRLDVRNEGLGRGELSFGTGPFTAFTGLGDIASIARVSSTFGGGFDREFRTQSFDGFVQDQWRPRSNFTLNYGARYEVNTAPVESRNRLVNYYPDLGGLVRAGSTTIYDPFGKQVGTSSKIAPRAGFETDLNNWSPRLGFAWSPAKSNRTVLRGAYAMVFDQPPLEPSVNMLLNPPFVMQDFSFLSGFFVSDSFAATSSGSKWSRLPYSITARDPGTHTSYVHQFNFGIQRQVSGQAFLEIAYVGSAGHKLPRLRDTSSCPPTVVLSPDPFRCFDTVKNPFLFPNIVTEENSANSNFHSLLVRWEMRGFRGLRLGAHYQFARSIDDSSSMTPQVFLVSPAVAAVLNYFSEQQPVISPLVVNGVTVQTTIIQPDGLAGLNNISPALSLRPTLPVITTRPRLAQDSTYLRGERSRSDFDIQQRGVADFIYDLPTWGRLRGLARGWQVAGIATLQSGQPYTVFVDFFGIPLRPDLNQKPLTNNHNPEAALDGGTLYGSPGSAFNEARNFSLLPGGLGRNSFTAPRLMNLDFSLMKNTHLGRGERKNMQFRAEFFNLLNTRNFREPYGKGGEIYFDPLGTVGGVAGPNRDLDPFFGRILQARPSREIQVALKINF